MTIETFKEIANKTLAIHPMSKGLEWKDWTPETSPESNQFVPYYRATLWSGEHIAGFMDIPYNEEEPETFITEWLNKTLINL